MRRGVTPSDSASAVPRSLVIETSISSASSQVANVASPHDLAQRDQASADQRQGHVHQRPGAPSGLAYEVRHLVVGQRLRAGQLVAGAAVGGEGVGHAVGYVIGPDRLEAGLAVAGDRQDGEEGEALQQGDPGVAGS